MTYPIKQSLGKQYLRSHYLWQLKDKMSLLTNEW